MKRFRIEVSVGLVLMLLCLVSSKRTPRGFRPSGRKLGHYRTLQKAKGMGDDPTMEPTVEDTLVKVVEKQPVAEAALAAEQEDEDEDEDDSKQDKNKEDKDDDDDDATEEPTFVPTNSPSFSPSDSPSLSPSSYWVQATTDPSAAGATTSEINDYWVSAPNEAPASTTNDYWVSNAVEETDAPASTPNGYWMQTPLEETNSPVSAPNEYWVQAAKEEETDAPGSTNNEEANNPVASTLPPTTYPTPSTNGNVVSPAEEAEPTDGAVDTPPEEEVSTELYRVRLPPLYLYVNMQGLVNEENFLDVIVDYMQYYMEQDFQGFDSVTYGATMFSMITTYSSLSKSSGSLDNPISNVTSHIHRLTAKFESKPTALDWEVEDYMEMLLEDEVRMQEYVEAQPNLDFSVLSTSVEYEETIAPTNVQDNTANGATGEEEEQDDRKNMTKIIGWTVGAFVVLLWVVFLYGIQSRGEVPS